MSRFIPIALVALSAFTSGCMGGLGHEGRSIEYYPDQRPRTLEAPYDATYELFAIAEPGVPPQLIWQAAILQNQHVGFIRGLDGTLIAYAAGQRAPLPEGHFRWQMIAESQRTNVRVFIDGTFDFAKGGGRMLGRVLGHALSAPESSDSRVHGSKTDKERAESRGESKPKSEEEKTKEHPDANPPIVRKEVDVP